MDGSGGFPFDRSVLCAVTNAVRIRVQDQLATGPAFDTRGDRRWMTIIGSQVCSAPDHGGERSTVSRLIAANPSETSDDSAGSLRNDLSVE